MLFAIQMQTIMSIFIFIFIFIFLPLLYVGLYKFYKRIMSRLADIATQRDLAYESEKGKNIATKEDVEEITSRLESVKNEISFAKQRENTFIMERYNHLHLFFKYIHKVQNFGNLLFYYLCDTESKGRLITLFHETNDNVSNVDYELQMLHAYIDNDKINNLLDDVVKRFTLYSCSIMVTMSNAISLLSSYEAMRDLAYSHGDNQQLMAAALANKNGFDNLKANYKGRQSKECKDFAEYLDKVVNLIKDIFAKQYPNQYENVRTKS